jgi:hypothetical protein
VKNLLTFVIGRIVACLVFVAPVYLACFLKRQSRRVRSL